VDPNQSAAAAENALDAKFSQWNVDIAKTPVYL
jgi:hypothetical protein